MGGAQISVDFTPWTTQTGEYNELGRAYHFTNLGGPGTATQVDLRVRLTIEHETVRMSLFGGGETKVTATPFVYLVFDPYMLEQTKFVVAIFAPSDDLASYEVLTAKVEAAATGVNFVVFDEANGEHLVGILKLGRQVTLRLMVPPEMETIAAVPLANDFAFGIAYEAFKRELLESR